MTTLKSILFITAGTVSTSINNINLNYDFITYINNNHLKILIRISFLNKGNQKLSNDVNLFIFILQILE